VLEISREERLAGVPEHLVWMSVQHRIVSDAELARRYRLVISLAYYAVTVMYSVVTLLVVLAGWLSLWAGELLLRFWPYPVGIVAVALASHLRGLRRLAYGRRRPRVLVRLARLLSRLLVIMAVTAGILYVWWAVVMALVAGAAVAYLVTIARRRRRRRKVIAALAAPVPLAKAA
jgi:hypothetical protein